MDLTPPNNIDVEEIVRIASREQHPAARRRLLKAIRLVEVFFSYKVTQHGGKEVRSTPLLRLSDGTHAMMLYTSKSHPDLPERFAGGAFKDTLAAALQMPPLDWVILSNSASQWAAIAKGQISGILDDLHSDREGQIGSPMASEVDPTGKILEDFITDHVRSKSDELPLPIGSVVGDRELFLDLTAGQDENGQPIMKTFQIQHLPHLIRVYTSRIRPGVTYGGIRWKAVKDMIRNAPEISGVQIMNNTDDWVVFDRESLGLDSSDK